MDILRNDLTFSLLARTLEGLAQRQELIAQNLANVNTPGYRRREVVFEDALRAALREAERKGLPPQEALASARFQPVVERSLFYRNDRGGVDLDREMAEQAKTALKLSAVLTILGKRIGMYKRTLEQGGM